MLLATAATDIPSLVNNTGPVAKSVLVVLLLFSLFSWSIIFSKWISFRRCRAMTRKFVRTFYKTRRLPEVHAVTESFRPSPVVEVFEAGYEELERQISAGTRSLAAVERAMRAESSDQITRLESRLNWLATTAAACPFIGLFGTVWGIIDAFQQLGTEGAATLRAVAPGISEALITTAAGLFAAVPALIAYNIYLNQLREFAAANDELGLEFVNRAESAVASASGSRSMQETR
jgi:biopolymer transport protein TolQ